MSGIFKDAAGREVYREETGASPSTATTPAISAGKQEAFPLASANVASAAQTVYGGDYIFVAVFGGTSVALQCLGPDGTTWQTILTKTTSDTAGGSGVALGSNAQVRVVLTGTTNAYAVLSRVP